MNEFDPPPDEEPSNVRASAVTWNERGAIGGAGAADEAACNDRGATLPSSRFSVNFFGQLFHSLPHSLTPSPPHSFSLQCVRACITAPHHREGRGGGRQVGGGRLSLPLLLKLKCSGGVEE